MICLTSQRLRVEIASPGESPADGFRFDRAGFVTDVVLDGAIHFCANEARNLRHPTSGGRGLCCEYAMDLSGEAAQGQWYPKFGVGLLRKGQEGYVFYKRYPECVPFNVTQRQEGEKLVFTTESLPCLGYGLRTEKCLWLTGNTLTMELRALNTGEKPLTINEYCHNFLSVDGMALSPDYRLDFPALADMGEGQLNDAYGKPCDYWGNGRGLTFDRYGAQGAWIHLGSPKEPQAQPFTWVLRHQGARAWVTGCDSFTPQKVDVWSWDHIIAPEVFIALPLKPGKSGVWRRNWTFSAEAGADG